MSNESLLATLKLTDPKSAEYNRIRTEILNANQGLIGMIIQRRGIKNPTHIQDCMDIGNISLLKAMDGYKAETGLLFTTYATTAIMNDITKFQRRLTRDRQRTPFSYDPARMNQAEDTEAVKVREHSAELKRILEENSANLTNIERDVIERRFGFTGAPQILEDIGIVHGLTKERIRQIETKALSKIREAAATLVFA